MPSVNKKTNKKKQSRSSTEKERDRTHLESDTPFDLALPAGAELFQFSIPDEILRYNIDINDKRGVKRGPENLYATVPKNRNGIRRVPSRESPIYADPQDVIRTNLIGSTSNTYMEPQRNNPLHKSVNELQKSSETEEVQPLFRSDEELVDMTHFGSQAKKELPSTGLNDGAINDILSSSVEDNHDGHTHNITHRRVKKPNINQPIIKFPPPPPLLDSSQNSPSNENERVHSGNSTGSSPKIPLKVNGKTPTRGASSGASGRNGQKSEIDSVSSEDEEEEEEEEEADEEEEKEEEEAGNNNALKRKTKNYSKLVSNEAQKQDTQLKDNLIRQYKKRLTILNNETPRLKQQIEILQRQIHPIHTELQKYINSKREINDRNKQITINNKEQSIQRWLNEMKQLSTNLIAPQALASAKIAEINEINAQLKSLEQSSQQQKQSGNRHQKTGQQQHKQEQKSGFVGTGRRIFNRGTKKGHNKPQGGGKYIKSGKHHRQTKKKQNVHNSQN